MNTWMNYEKITNTTVTVRTSLKQTSTDALKKKKPILNYKPKKEEMENMILKVIE